jgi:cell wall-associated NlpC family hydrolase
VAAGAGIPGVAVGMATAGGLLVYAGLRDVTPLDALRDIASGRVTGVSRSSSPTAVALAQQSGGPGSQAPSVIGAGASLVAAARRYVGGRYRSGGTDPATGLDCSGLVQRSFRDIGVPGCPRTSGQQLVWAALTRVPRQRDAQPGDLVFWTGHVAIATAPGATTVVGALNSRVGVREGPIGANGVRGQPPVAIRRYAGAQSAAPGGSAGGGSW